MAETLRSWSIIKLYGRLMDDLILDPEGHRTQGNCGNEFLRQQLGRVAGADNLCEPKLARIYGFSYEGYYYSPSREFRRATRLDKLPRVCLSPSQSTSSTVIFQPSRYGHR